MAVKKSQTICPCPIKEDKPITIQLVGMEGESGKSAYHGDCLYIATIEVVLVLDAKKANDYSRKELTIKDLNDMIENRK